MEISFHELFNQVGKEKSINRKSEILQENDNFSFELSNGKIINIDKKGNFSIGFKETTYELSQLLRRGCQTRWLSCHHAG